MPELIIVWDWPADEDGQIVGGLMIELITECELSPRSLHCGIALGPPYRANEI